MRRLIDATEYRKELNREMFYPGRTKEFMDAIEVAIADLSDMSTIDAVEVVRCKDCKFCDKEYVNDNFIGYCKNKIVNRGVKINGM